LIETTLGQKCSKCNDLSEIPKTSVHENKIGILSHNSFPFEQNKYYTSPDIREALDCDKQSGISYNKNFNFLTLIRYAHKLEPNTTNPYLDVYYSGYYHYVGKGATGDQTLNGINGILKNSKNTGTKIHLFWQHNPNSDHQYVGQVNLEKYEPQTQPDKNGDDRNVWVFTLKPIDI
jgi:hypothetical protein